MCKCCFARDCTRGKPAANSLCAIAHNNLGCTHIEQTGYGVTACVHVCSGKLGSEYNA
jgi:hypothetical protein